MLKKIYRKKTGRKEWALVSRSNPKKVLKWFGPKKPSKEEFLKEERRVQYWKHVKGQAEIPVAEQKLSVLKEAKKDIELPSKIPQKGRGPVNLTANNLPIGVEKGSAQEKIWKALFKTGKLRKLTAGLTIYDKWLVALWVYKQAAIEAKIPPFKDTGTSVSDLNRLYLMFRSATKDATEYAYKTLVGLNPEAKGKIKLSKVVFSSCPYYAFDDRKCLIYVFSSPKNKKVTQRLEDYAKSLGMSSMQVDDLVRSMPQAIDTGIRAWKAGNNKYLVEKLRQVVVIIVKPSPLTEVKDLRGLISNIRSIANRELTKYI